MNLQLTNETLKFLQNSGWLTIVILIILLILYSITRTKWFGDFIGKVGDKLISKFFKKKKEPVEPNHIVESDIINHDIFNYIDLWQFNMVPTLQYSTEYRTVVFRKYLRIYLEKHRENINQFVADGKYKNMSETELWKNFFQLINDITYDYEKEMAQVGIPPVIIEKMKLKNNDTLSLTIDLIEGICNSQFYESEGNLLKIYSILNIMLSILENTVSNSSTICNSINGQLAGLQMDGKIEPEAKH